MCPQTRPEPVATLAARNPRKQTATRIRRAFLATSLVLLPAIVPAITLGIYTPAAHGQASSSSDAVGKILDTTGASIPGATVHIINNGNGAERTTTTNDAGEFSAPNLPPANYRVRVEKAGFKTSQVPSLDVEIGKTANVALTLSVGGTNEIVEVTTLPPQLQTAEATVGQVIDQKQINDLPLNGRNVLQLATLSAGVSPSQTSNTGNPCAACGSRNLYVTVDGGRASSTNYVLDGTYIRSVRFNTESLQPSTDTIQEFNLLRSTFSTEYGQGQAVVSMVTKSGSNGIHGSGYEFARNAIFDARNYFTTYTASPVKPSFSRNQYGGTIGAPIKKDKFFIFGGYEGLRTSRGISLFALYPTQAQLNTATAPSGINAIAALLSPTFPTPNGTYQNGAANYTRNDNFIDNFDVYTVRADQTLSQRNSLFERMVYYNSSQFTPAVQGGGTSNPLNGRNGVIGDTFLITPKIVNEVRVGYNYFYNFGVGVNVSPGTNWAAQEGLQNVTSLTDKSEYGRSSISIVGYSALTDPGTDQGGNENILSVGDSLSWVLGRHTLKLGGQFQNRRVIQKADNNGRGAFTFGPCTAATPTSAGTCDPTNKYLPGTNTLYNALQNYQRGYCTASCNGNAGTTLGHYRDNTYGAFINDVWQFGHGITINAGLRWEYNAPWVEQNGLEGTLDPASGKIKYSKIPTVIPAAFLPYVNTTSTFNPGIINPNKKGFGPRLGVAYEPKAGTVVRAGYGIYFDNLNTNELQFTRYAAPLYYQQSFSNVFDQNQFPNPATATVLPAPFSILPNNSTPYTMEWTASVQQDMGHGFILELAYTGSESHKLWKRFDQNMDLLVPGYASAGVSNNFNAGVRPFTQFQHGILTSSTEASANFHGGSAKVEKRAKNGLYILGVYQWSKNLDNNSGEADANDTSYSTSFAFDHSFSNFDVRHRSVISGGYELPFGRGKEFLQKGVGNALAGGWSLQPAVQLRTGYPFSPSRSGATFGVYTPGRVNLAPGRTLQSAFINNPSPFHWFDASAFVDPGGALQGNVTRNTLRGPGTAQVDFSAIKAFTLTERVRAQFRAEAYNIINRANFANPASNISTTSSVGQVSSTSNDNRDLQFAIKIIF